MADFSITVYGTSVPPSGGSGGGGGGGGGSSSGSRSAWGSDDAAFEPEEQNPENRPQANVVAANRDPLVIFQDGMMAAQWALKAKKCNDFIAGNGDMLRSLGLNNATELLKLYEENGWMAIGNTIRPPNGMGPAQSFANYAENLGIPNQNLGGVTGRSSIVFLGVDVPLIDFNVDSFMFTGQLSGRGANGELVSVAASSVIGPFFMMSQSDITATLILHELAHVTKAIPNDGRSPALSNTNSWMIADQCF